jgi:hypothetical protein
MGTLYESFTGRIGFYGRFLQALLQFYGQSSSLRAFIRAFFTDMEYSLFFCVF